MKNLRELMFEIQRYADRGIMIDREFEAAEKNLEMATKQRELNKANLDSAILAYQKATKNDNT